MQTQQLRNEIRLLAGIAPSDAPFLNAFLDLTPGPKSAWTALHEQATKLWRTASPSAEKQLDDLFADLETTLSAMPEGIAGMAIHSRGTGMDHLCRILPLAVPLATRLSISEYADTLPLTRACHSHGRFLLVWVRRPSIQIAEIDLGTPQIRAWSMTPTLVSDSTGRGNRRQTQRSWRLSLQSVERLLHANQDLPVVLAGEQTLVNEFTSNLNRVFQARQIARIRVPAACDSYDSVLQAALLAYSRQRASVARCLADRVLSCSQSDESAVTGVTDTLDALLRGRVDTLIMVDDPDLFLDYQNPTENFVDRHALPMQTTPGTLNRAAIEHHIPIEIVSAGHPLREYDGIGSLLNRPAHPIAERPDTIEVAA